MAITQSFSLTAKLTKNLAKANYTYCKYNLVGRGFTNGIRSRNSCMFLKIKKAGN